MQEKERQYGQHSCIVLRSMNDRKSCAGDKVSKNPSYTGRDPSNHNRGGNILVGIWGGERVRVCGSTYLSPLEAMEAWPDG